MYVVCTSLSPNKTDSKEETLSLPAKSHQVFDWLSVYVSHITLTRGGSTQVIGFDDQWNTNFMNIFYHWFKDI